MFRRAIVVLTLVTLSGAFLSACSPNPKPVVVVSEQPVVLTPKEEPSENPPAVENPTTVVSSVIDTSDFTQQATVSGWELSEDLSYVVVTIRLSKDDWLSFAWQASLSDKVVDPSQVQLSEETARSLIDLDQLAGDVIEFREERDVTPVDIRTIEAHYELAVSGL